MTVTRKTPAQYLSPRGKFPSFLMKGSGLADWDKEMAFGLLDLVDAVAEWDQNKMTIDALSRYTATVRHGPSVDPYRGSIEPEPPGFHNAITMADVFVEEAENYEADEDNPDFAEAALEADDDFMAQLAALMGAGLLSGDLYKRNYRRRKNPTTTEHTEFLNACFYVIQAYKLTYEAWLEGYSLFTENILRKAIIGATASNFTQAMNRYTTFYFKEAEEYTHDIINSLRLAAKASIEEKKRLQHLSNAKESLAEIIGAGFNSPFWTDTLWEEVTATLETSHA